MNKATKLAVILLLLPAWAAPPPSPGQGHPHGKMDEDCSLCHDETSWEVPERPSGFDHQTTGFVLEGGHARAGCKDCHDELIFAHVGSHCADCHVDIHLGRLGPACHDCHGTDDWVDRPRMIQEHNSTAFPLVGAHERVDCDACHTGGPAAGYLGTPTDCYFCHAAEYAETVDPDHLASDFGTDCRICHGVYASSWGAADFIHPGNFALTGAHAVLDCNDCHDSGYAGTPTDCYACHQADYEGTTDPDHSALVDFDTDCISCHSTTAWESASYAEHDAAAFPIYSGSHAGKWISCTDCHETSYPDFECIFCHEHDDETELTLEHDGVSGFEYLSSECYFCHQNGEAD